MGNPSEENDRTPNRRQVENAMSCRVNLISEIFVKNPETTRGEPCTFSAPAVLRAVVGEP